MLRQTRRTRALVVLATVSVTALSNDPPFNDVLWFAGTTRREGAEGRGTFHDPELAGNPASGELTWGANADGDFLALECLLGDDAGDRPTRLTKTVDRAAPLDLPCAAGCT